MMDLELAEGIIDILLTMQDAVKQMLKAYEADHMEEFHSLSMDLWDGLTAVRKIAGQEAEHCEEAGRLTNGIICGLESLKDIKMLVTRNSKEVMWKLECELLMIIENLYLEFYCRRFVKGNAEKKEDFLERIMSTGNYSRLSQKMEERTYGCDLSIFMPAYNHLDYSKSCVESILANLPKEITYEIILYNHGSNDGTREYFESISGVHVLNAAINRAFYTAGMRTIKGKYSLHVSNDIIIGKNAIENMYRAISEHDDYGWVVPSTPAVSNLQSIPADYNDWEEFQAFTIKNNVYDEKCHEERTRLCNPVTMIRTDDFNRLQRDLYEQFFCISDASSFPDDKISLWMRRHGYKNILAKDAYCHHFGSVTHRNDWDSQKEQIEYFEKGRREFFKDFGIDPWGTGFCYDYTLFQNWNMPWKEDAVILGLNCGLGSNSLKIKEVLKEKGAKNTLLYNGFQEERYLRETESFSDRVFLFASLKDIVKETGKSKFDFIIIEDAICGCGQDEYQREMKKNGILYGEMVYKDEDGNWHIVD